MNDIVWRLSSNEAQFLWDFLMDAQDAGICDNDEDPGDAAVLQRFIDELEWLCAEQRLYEAALQPELMGLA
jgi:hypothetical protein